MIVAAACADYTNRNQINAGGALEEEMTAQ
jgi:hypothetical protein